MGRERERGLAPGTPESDKARTRITPVPGVGVNHEATQNDLIVLSLLIPKLAEGLSWKDPAGRTRTETDLAEWQGARAGAGKMAPRGFPRDNRFT